MASSEGISGVVDAAPELANQPGLALAAANSVQPQGAAETLGAASWYSGVAQSTQQFQQDQGVGTYAGLTQKSGSPALLHDAGAALRVLNMPLNQVQHTYRYIRDVYHRHGWLSGIMETLGVAAGAVIGGIGGTVLGGGGGVEGAILGAEGAGWLEGHLFHTDSWKATSNPHYMIGGHLVSPGRDLASLLGFHANRNGQYQGWGSLVSGLTDAGVDWYEDPLMVAGKIRGLTRSEAGARQALFGAQSARGIDIGSARVGLRGVRWGFKDEQALQDSGNRVAQFLYRMAPGTGLDVNNPDAIVNAYHAGSNPAKAAVTGYGGVKRAIDTIASITPESVGKTNPEQVENAKDLITQQIAGVNDQLDKLNPDAPDPEAADRFTALNGIKQRLESMDPHTLVAVGKLVGQFPELAPMAEELVKAQTPDDVLRVFRDSLFQKEMIGRLTRGALPSRTLMRAGFQKIVDKVADQDLTRQQESGLLFGLNPGEQAQQGLQMVQNINGKWVPRSPLTADSFNVKRGTLNPLSPKYLSRKIRTFSGYQPYTPDRNTLGINYEFDPSDPNAAQGILRSMKFGMGARTGELWTAIMLHAARTGDTALAKKIWGEGMIENLKAMGLPDDPSLVDYVTRKSRFMAQGDFSTQQYGVGYYSGDLASLVKTEAGTQHQALWNWQRGYLAYPDFLRTKAALRQLSAYTKVFGRLDDFAAEHYTNSFFKPLALVTMGFGLRIALNEAIIGTAKYGNPAYLQQMANAKLAKYGYSKAELLDGFHNAELNEQVQMMKAAIHASGGWAKFASGMVPDDKLDLALRVIAENDGHIVKGVIASGHSGYGRPDDAPSAASQDLHNLMQVDRGRFSFQHKGSPFVPNGSYVLVPHDASNFEDSYLAALVRRANERPAQLIANDLRDGFTMGASAPTSEIVGWEGTGAASRPVLSTGNGARRVASDNDYVTLYHGTTSDRAEALRTHGARPGSKAAPARTTVIESEEVARALGRNVGDTVEYEPGRGLGPGFYLTASRGEARNYAETVASDTGGTPEVLPVRVRVGDLKAAPERAHRGMTPLQSLRVGDGYTEAALGPEAFRPGAETEPEARIRDAFSYAVDRERKRIAGINPETGDPYLPEEDPYGYERNVLARHLSQTEHEFANARVDDLLNLVVGRDQTIHDHLIDKLADGEQITRGDVSKIDELSRPRKIAGEELAPWVGPGLWQNTLQGAYKVLVDPVVNNLSRQPLFLNAVEKHYNALKGAVEHGLIDDRDALRFAQFRAMNEMLPMIHNTALRTQFSLMVRNLAPFYFAQEQAMKRAGKAVLDSPQVLARWQLISHYTSDPAWIHKQSGQGQSAYAVYPVIGAFGDYLNHGLAHLGIPVIGGIPLTATGDTQSLQTVLPEMRVPSASPIVSVPLNWLANADPLIAPFTKDVLGDRGFKQNLLNSFVPSAAVRNAIEAGMGDTNFSSFSNAQLMAIASAYYHGDLPTAADYEGNGFAAQQKMEKVRNMARSLFAFKAILSLFAPMSPNVSSDFGLQQEWYNILDKTRNQPGTALDDYLAKHGDKAIAFTVTHSQNAVGAYIPYVKSVQQFLQDNLPTIEQHPLAMSYLTPQSGQTGDVQVIHDELMRLALKEQRTPDEFLQAIYQQQGERVWRASENAYYQAKGNAVNPILSQAWNDYQQQFRLWNPVAYNYIKSADRPTRALYIYNDLKTVYASGLAPNTPEADAVAGLMDQFDAHWQQMAPLVAARDKTAIAQQTEQYHQQLVQLANQQPNLDSVIYNVFMHLDGVLTGNS